MNRNAIALALVLLVGIAGCATSSGYKRGPNGQPVHYISGLSAAAALKKADALCPQGYNVIGNPGLKEPFNYAMNIECKAPGQLMASGNGNPPPGRAMVPLFEIDISTRCREFREESGPLMQATCLENEPAAKAWLQTRHTTPEIAVICGRILQNTRYYGAAKACVEEQERAEQRLPAETPSQKPAGKWW